MSCRSTSYATQELEALQQAAAQQHRALQLLKDRAIRQRRQVGKRDLKRIENCFRFGVIVLSLLAPDLAWVPKVVRRFELSAECEEYETEICRRFLKMPCARIHDLHNPSSQLEIRLLKQARDFAVEWMLVVWVDSLNAKGGAPTPADVIQERLKILTSGELAASTSIIAPTAALQRSAGYKWSLRFRKRWNICLERPAFREVVPLETLRLKVLL